jgi:hypothetical protein
MKKIILSLLVTLTTTGAMAQITPTPNGDKTQWTFGMPAYDVEVSTELYYKLSETATDNKANYGTKTNVFLERTIKADNWNTFCAPFDISDSKLAAVFGEGVKVKQLSSSDYNSTTKVLTLTFIDATSIAAGTPYLIKLNGASDVNLTADGKEFADITQNWTASNVETDYVHFKPVLVPEELTKDDKSVLFVASGNKLTYPNKTANINAFRAYFKLVNGAETAASSFNMDLGDGETTGIVSVTNTNRTNNTNVYDLQGRKVENAATKGVYIQNGKKVIIK